MLRRKRYEPTETHLALHPEPPLLICACGVRFARRPETEEDDGEKCLTCNRKSWSRLFRHQAPPARPVYVEEEAEVLPMIRRVRS